jgi:SAM-dependent methyltransferase
MEAELYQRMFEQEQQHWWFRAKRRIVLTLLERLLPPRSRIADVGCGCGATLLELAQRYEAIGMDGSPIAADFARRRGVSVVEGRLPDAIGLPQGSFDAVLMLDVLEHLDAPVESAKAAADLLRPGGLLLATVPAYQWLFSAHDVAHHHRRRYTRGALVQQLTAAGLTPIFSSYMNTSLFPLAAAARIAERALPRRGKASIGLEVPPAPVNGLFQCLFASERHLLGRVRLPFGLSVIAAARKD